MLINLEKRKLMIIKMNYLNTTKNNGTEPSKFEHLNCYNRIDNDKLIGYHFDLVITI